MSELKHKLSALTEQLRNSEAVHYTIMYPRHIESLKSISMHTPHLRVQEAAAGVKSRSASGRRGAGGTQFGEPRGRITARTWDCV